MMFFKNFSINSKSFTFPYSTLQNFPHNLRGSIKTFFEYILLHFVPNRLIHWYPKSQGFSFWIGGENVIKPDLSICDLNEWTQTLHVLNSFGNRSTCWGGAFWMIKNNYGTKALIFISLVPYCVFQMVFDGISGNL